MIASQCCWGTTRELVCRVAMSDITAPSYPGKTLPMFGGGGLDVRLSGGGRTMVMNEMGAGDAVVLCGAWHKPRAIFSGRRLVFVFFFRYAGKPSCCKYRQYIARTTSGSYSL